jgi:hypothetical protein
VLSLLLPLTLLLPAVLGTDAVADDRSCVDCCKDTGLYACPTKIKAFGDGSLATPEAGGWRVLGAWTMDCETGPKFDRGTTVVLDHQPVGGEILRLASPPAAVRCFATQCAWPKVGCMYETDGIFILSHCEEGRPLMAQEMLLFDPAPASVEPVRGPLVPVRLQTPVAVPAIPAQVIFQPTSPQLFVVEIDSDGNTVVPQATTQVDLLVPTRPAPPCNTGDLQRAEAGRRLDAAENAAASGQLQPAINELLAAIVLDRCHAQAWALLGELALKAGHMSKALDALQVATELEPRHHMALTHLGQAYESLGFPRQAQEAFRDALEVVPGFPAATDGMKRLANAP